MKKQNLIVGWSLTNLCNLSCMHCYNESGKKKDNELSTSEALEVVEKLSKANVTAVNFGGGECALRPDFIEICQALAENNIEISYTTNGTVLDILKPYLELFHDIGVSIDFADPSAHNLFRGKDETFEKAIECIDYLVENNVNTEIVTCLTRLNSTIPELTKLYELVKKHNVDFWRLNRYRATGRAIYNDEWLGLDEGKLKVAFDYLNALREPDSAVADPIFRALYGGTYQIEGDPSGKYSFRIQVNGEVSPSVFLSESGGNIKDKSIDEILDSEVFTKIREKKPEGKCKKCNEYYHCQGGDAGLSYIMNNHFNGPDPLCYKDVSEPKNTLVKKIQNENPNVHELYLCTLYIPIGDRNGK